MLSYLIFNSFLDTQMSLAPTPEHIASMIHNIIFMIRLSDFHSVSISETSQNDIAVAPVVADMVAVMFAHIVTKLGTLLLLAKLGTPNLVRDLVTGVG